MSRDALLRADTDTGKMSDPKVLALARFLRDPMQTSAALILHESVVLASWRDGERLALPDCLPAWWIGPEEVLERLVAALIAVRLLDDEQRVPEHAFESWFAPVVERLMDRDRRNIFAGLRRQGMPVDQANREADKRVREAVRWKPKAQPKGEQPKAQPNPSLPHPQAQPPASPPASQPTAEQEEEMIDAVRADPSGPPGVSAKDRLLANGLDLTFLGAKA